METTTDRLLLWSRGKKPGPFKLQFNPTDRCNLKCLFCWERDETMLNYVGELSQERYIEIIDEAKDIGVKLIEITGGGEPTSRKDLVLNIIERVKKNEMIGTMITNGTLLNEEDIERIIASGWDELVISLDGLKENHELLRDVKGCFDLTFNNVKKIQALKKKHKSDTPKISIHFVLTRINYRDITPLLKMLAELGIKNFFIEPLVQLAFNVSSGHDLKITPELHKDLNKELVKASKICFNYSIENNLERFISKDLIENTNKMDNFITKKFIDKKEKHPMLNFPCYEPWYHMVVRPNGKVGPCCMFDHSSVSLADMSLRDVWESDYFRNVRKDLSQGNLKGFCSKCNPSLVTNTEKMKEKLRKMI